MNEGSLLFFYCFTFTEASKMNEVNEFAQSILQQSVLIHYISYLYRKVEEIV